MPQPLKVTCPSCDAKFHIPLHLVRGKVVSFRCKKCRGTIPVDGRALSSATPQPLPAPSMLAPETPDARSQFYSEPPPMRLSMSDGIVQPDGFPTTAGLQVDTPASFTHSSPPPPPPLVARYSAPPIARTPAAGFAPAMLVSAPPPGFSRTDPPEGLLPSDPPPSFRSSSRNGKKVVAAAALLGAASLTAWSMSRQPHAGATPAAAPAAAEEHAPRAQPNEQRAPGTEQARPSSAGATEPAKLSNSNTVAKDSELAPPKAAPGALRPAKARAAKPAGDKTATDTPAEAAQPAEEAVPAPAAQPLSPSAAAALEATNSAAANSASQEIEFDREAARRALEDAGQKAAGCRTIDTPAGPARVTVIFAPSGIVTSAIVESGPLVGTSAGGCLAAKVRGAHVPAFTGEPVTVKKSISF
jgi:predicted Zn finger-like uncharacterized protein